MMISLNALETHKSLIRETTKDLDFWRLLFIRSRRMLLLSARLLEQFEVYGQWIKFLDNFLRVLALYQACLLMPRFVLNVLYVSQHLRGPLPSDMIARCWEMAYDFGWILNGVLAAFILVGPLAPLVIYLPVLTPSYQLCVHTTRFLIEYYRFKALEYNDKNMDLLKQEASATLLPLVIKMGVSACVISMGMVMLIGSTNPVIPFLAAVVTVAVTIAGRYCTKNVSKWPNALEDLHLMPFSRPDECSAGAHAKFSLFASKQHADRIEENKLGYPLVLHEKSC